MTMGNDLKQAAIERAVVETHGAYNQPGSGVKADQGKLQWHLLPSQVLRGVVRVLMIGAKKYAPHNWRKGMPYSQTYNAVRRHLDAWEAGEDTDVGNAKDPGTLEHHLDCALCELIFLRTHVMEHPELDDRYKDTVPGLIPASATVTVEETANA